MGVGCLRGWGWRQWWWWWWWVEVHGWGVVGWGPAAEIKVWEKVIGRERGGEGAAGRKDRWKLRKGGTTVGAAGK